MDPLLSLAFSMQSGKGVYALMLGSGVSRSAGILTGWEIVLDLLRQVAQARGEDPGGDPAAWYRAAFNEEPDYSRLLAELAGTQAERSRLLRAYFEPTQEEEAQGLKTPAVAHRAVANLVADGYLRVIVTTNFDRLIERALEAVGVAPAVISTADAAAGALPLAHERCTVLKVHGDYLDPRIKNTPDELAEYEPPLNRLLDQILDEYGLIVAGWSGDWDAALRAALDRAANRRFTTFWATRGALSDGAGRLVARRSALIVPIRDADAFLLELREKVKAIEHARTMHPLTTEVLVQQLKRHLTQDPIRLHDLVVEEAERIHAANTDQEFPVQGVTPERGEYLRRARAYESLSEGVVAMLANGAYWGASEHDQLWAKTVQRLAGPSGAEAGYVVWANLKRYPALLGFYAAGIGAVAAEKYRTVGAMARALVTRPNERPYSVLSLLNPAAVGERQWHMDNRRTPVSDSIQILLRPHFRLLIPEDRSYEATFDRWECLVAMMRIELHEGQYLGTFSWRARYRDDDNVLTTVGAEMERDRDSWAPIQAGLFEGFESAQASFNAVRQAVANYW